MSGTRCALAICLDEKMIVVMYVVETDLLGFTSIWLELCLVLWWLQLLSVHLNRQNTMWCSGFSARIIARE